MIQSSKPHIQAIYGDFANDGQRIFATIGRFEEVEQEMSYMGLHRHAVRDPMYYR